MMKKFTTLVALLAACVFTSVGQEVSVSNPPQDDEVRYNQYGVAVDRYVLNSEAQNDIIVFENRAKGYKFWMDNRVQMDGQTFFGEPTGFDHMAGGVTMRRVRSAFKAQLHDWLYGEIDLNFSGGQFELEDAIVRYEDANMDISLGNFKEDFSMEETTTSRYTTFMERAMVVSAFAPGRHIGARINYHRDWFRISAGVSWQLVDEFATASNVEEQNKAGIAQGTNFTNKIVFMPWASSPYQGLHLGFNWSYRAPSKVDNTADWEGNPGFLYYADEYSTRQNSNINRRKFLNTDRIANVAYDMLYGAELAGYYKGLRFTGEFIWNNTYMLETAANRNTKLFYGYYAQLSYLLFGGVHRYDISQSEFTQPTRGRSWGDVELMARWDYLNLTSQDIFGGAGQNFTFGVVYHINNNLKAMVNYSYSQNDAYANGKGRLVIGYDSDGRPTTNHANLDANSIQGARFHSISARVEIDF